jgi:DNA polymerase-3 subunit delta
MAKAALEDLPHLLEEAAAGRGKPIYLLEGDEYLTKTAARELAEALVPERDRPLNLILIDAAAGAKEIAQHLVTIAMFHAPKAVVVEGAEVLAEEVDAEKELGRARELWLGKRQRDGARRLLKLVRGAGWGPAELAFGLKGAAGVTRWRKEVGAAPSDADKGWLQELAAYAAEQKLAVPQGDVEALVRALERGLPPRTHLLLVAEALPARHPLARLAAEKGACLKRKAERRGRGIDTLDISEVVAQELGPLQKRLSRDAELELKLRLGDDLRLLASELQKLACYVGDKPQIGREDVEAIVAPVREEEFFALGEAVGEGDLSRALELFAAELRRKSNASSVALPFLGGIASAVRRLLAEHARCGAIPAARGPRELSMDEYQRAVFPAVEAELLAKGQKIPHPYGAWIAYKRARRRPRSHWVRALILCAEADAAIKRGAEPRLLLERLLTDVAPPPGRSPA